MKIRQTVSAIYDDPNEQLIVFPSNPAGVLSDTMSFQEWFDTAGDILGDMKQGEIVIDKWKDISVYEHILVKILTSQQIKNLSKIRRTEEKNKTRWSHIYFMMNTSSKSPCWKFREMVKAIGRVKAAEIYNKEVVKTAEYKKWKKMMNEKHGENKDALENGYTNKSVKEK